MALPESIHTLFVIAYENDETAIYETKATPALLTTLENPAELETEIVTVEGSGEECATLPLLWGTGIDAVTALVGTDVAFTRVTEQDFLTRTKTDGIDMFY